MDPCVVTFHLGLEIGVIGPTLLHISRYLFGYHIHFFGLLWNRGVGLIVHLFDIYKVSPG
jgi:hypothetical protein